MKKPGLEAKAKSSHLSSKRGYKNDIHKPDF